MHKSLFAILAIAALLVVAGCGSKEVPAANSGASPEPSVEKAADTTATSEIDEEELSSLDSSELDSLDQDLAVI
ncbi:hypothetical protein HYT57_02745 [Candidatus Woesearchaeota archaeon]|nr:hypothetical protein [Candidatus Woesearchaeota archaeon]